MTKSNIIGAANNESSHVLCMTSVLWPPIIISLVYSSIAFLVSPEIVTKIIQFIVFKKNYFQMTNVLDFTHQHMEHI